MEIYTNFVIINNATRNTTVLPENIKLISYDNDTNNITISYSIDNCIKYTKFDCTCRSKYYFLEIINNSLLWSINFKSECQTYNSSYKIKYIILLNLDYIDKYYGESSALNMTIYTMWNKLISNYDISGKKYIPSNDMIKQPKKFNVKLYNYQKKTINKMLEIEQDNNNNKIGYIYKGKIENIDMFFDPLSKTLVKKEKGKMSFKLSSKGGILADEMGLGKTISSIGLIYMNQAPKKISEFVMCNNINKINSKATLIICPSHLAKQWEHDIKRSINDLKILTILTKSDHSKIIYNDFIESDVIITTQQFIMNFKNYQSINYKSCSASSINFYERISDIKNFYQNILINLGLSELKEFTNPLFECFNFHRLIIDEGHEIFGNMLNNMALSKYMSLWINNINANYYWYISGTPFMNEIAILNTFKFIHLRLKNDNYDINFTDNTNILLPILIEKEIILDNILKSICIRHLKNDVEDQINIFGYEEEIVWVKLTKIEKKLYDVAKNNYNRARLQQLCCHPLVVDNNIFKNNEEIDLNLMRDSLISHHKKNYDLYKDKLSKLDPVNREYAMIKKKYESIINESKYMFTILEKLNSPDILADETCSICLMEYTEPVMTICGHIYCNECIKAALLVKNTCPNCKNDIKGKDLLLINNNNIIDKNNIEDIEEKNIIIEKYGSKLGKLILMITDIIENKKNRIIVFSQWDYMLSLIGKSLNENNINNCFVKGSVFMRNSSINKFKEDDNNMRVIMLSLKNAASGTNLIEATHIFFVEPIDASKEEINTIETQAIARACRIGQKQKVKLIRILIKETIEEEIYNNIKNNEIKINNEIII